MTADRTERPRMERPLAVGIATRNRPDVLLRCLRSLRHVGDLLDEVIVVDDGSATPVEPALRAALGAAFPADRLTVVRHDASRGLSAARNLAAGRARAPWLLNLDDDAELLSGDAVRAALAVLERDATVGAVAFAQADAAGAPFPAGAQPAPGDRPAVVATFIGFAYLLRRDAARAIGGFREALLINGEEREFCLRLLDAGWRVVYLPDARVAHLSSPLDRDLRRYLQLVVRNGCLDAIYNLPAPLAVVVAAQRLAAYFRMRRGWGVHDPGGFGEIARWLAARLPAALRDRRPVRWATVRRWRALTRAAPAYEVRP